MKLFAQARGYVFHDGDHRCFFCGSPCGDQFASKDYVRQSFTSRDTVCGGEHVCGGCVAAMDEKATITLANGEQRTGQKTRCYSWVFNAKKATAYTKAHREELLAVCLKPPNPPFVICISDSGQKHLIYRSAVSHISSMVVCTLEGETIIYHPDELSKRMELCKKLAAVIGKPSLSEVITTRSMMSIVEYHQDESILTEWLSVAKEPITRLAIWFTPAKKECENEYQRTPTGGDDNGRVQAAFGWSD